jgi:outer membrane lipoprotein LolB
VTRQSWRLTGGDGPARLEGLEGGTREGPDGSALLLEASGLEVPVAALASWVRGARADEARFGPAELAFAADHRPARLLQAGWVIDYLAWEEPGDAHGGVLLPLRVDARRGDARVRLVVDAWSVPEPP